MRAGATGARAGGAVRCPINHVGLSVPDIELAVSWYRDVLDFCVLLPPTLITQSDDIAADVFGPRFRHMYIAQLSSGADCGLELFQFIVPEYERPADNFRYWEGGFFHICVTRPDVEELAKRIAKTGGRVRGSRVWAMDLAESTVAPGPYLTIYCEDPFGNIVEIFSHTHSVVYGPRERWRGHATTQP
jgi:catechol 2,3-dioxygenase-like lactoylglutathione lyase family enzyme